MLYLKSLPVLILTLATSQVISQTPYPENNPVNSYPIGMYYQQWTTTSTLNWTYPYSTKLTVNQSEARNFEITTKGKDGEGLAFRQWSQSAGAWRPWKNILTDNGNGLLTTLHVKHSSSGFSPDNVTGLFVESSGSSGGYYVFQTASVGGGKSFSVTNAGYVGIGTPSPEGVFHVNNISNSIPSAKVSGVDADFSFGAHSLLLSAKPGFNNVPYIAWLNNNNVRMAYLGWRSDVFNLQLENGFNFSINGGNVGIGTSSPDAKLAVKGDIHTREVRVDLAGSVGPDYVFEKDYNLLPLSEVEAYVNQNKHLPEVPSAKEMEENGLNLKEMNLLLLKKVEELTLHLIEKEKQMESIEKRLAQLEKK